MGEVARTVGRQDRPVRLQFGNGGRIGTGVEVAAEEDGFLRAAEFSFDDLVDFIDLPCLSQRGYMVEVGGGEDVFLELHDDHHAGFGAVALRQRSGKGTNGFLTAGDSVAVGSALIGHRPRIFVTPLLAHQLGELLELEDPAGANRTAVQFADAHQIGFALGHHIGDHLVAAVADVLGEDADVVGHQTCRAVGLGIVVPDGFFGVFGFQMGRNFVFGGGAAVAGRCRAGEAEQQHDGKIFFQNVHRFVRF